MNSVFSPQTEFTVYRKWTKAVLISLLSTSNDWLSLAPWLSLFSLVRGILVWTSPNVGQAACRPTRWTQHAKRLWRVEMHRKTYTSEWLCTKWSHCHSRWHMKRWWEKCLPWIDNRCDGELFISIMSSISVMSLLTAASDGWSWRCTQRVREMRERERQAVSYRCAIVTPNKPWQPGD